MSYLYRRVYDGWNYRLRTLAGGRFTGYVRPVSIGILLTLRCNARCVHCDIWKNRGPEETPTLEQWKQLLSDLRSWLGPVHVFLTGGEALLRPYVTDLVFHGSSIGLAIELLTHGYWKDQRRIELLARACPWRITLSLDGIGPTHSRIRGHDDFWEQTTRSIQTFCDVRRREARKYVIRLKTVIMAQNIDCVVDVAHYAATHGLEVFYQPIERNYNTPEDPLWFENAPTWPKDSSRAVQVVKQLCSLKRLGLPIANSVTELEAMIPYFRNPTAHQESVKSHSAHECHQLCAALTTLQIEPNGDVLACCRMPPVGNIKDRGICQIWMERPRWWDGECCKSRSCDRKPSS